MFNQNTSQDHTRDNVIANEADGFRLDEAWTDRDAVQEDHSLNDHEQVFLDYLAFLQREGRLNHNGKTHQITHGTRWLTDKLSPVSVERLEAWDLIKRPTIDEGNGTVEREQLMRRSMWDLGDRAHDYINDDYLYGEGIGDRNERMGHSMGGAAVRSLYNHHNDHPELTVYPYSKLDDDGPVYDAIIYDTAATEVVAVVEVETRVGDAKALASDAEKLADAPGQSWWLFPTRKAQNRALSNMQRKGIIGNVSGKKRWPDTLATKLTRQRINEELDKGNYYNHGQSPPVTQVATYDEMRSQLEEHCPWAIHDYVGTENSGEDR